MPAIGGMHHHQRHTQTQEIHRQMEHVLRLEKECLQEQPQHETEQRGNVPKQQIDGNGPHQMKFRRADRQVPELHQNREEYGGQCGAQPVGGVGQQRFGVDGQQAGGGHGGHHQFVLWQDADFDMHASSSCPLRDVFTGPDCLGISMVSWCSPVACFVHGQDSAGCCSLVAAGCRRGSCMATGLREEPGHFVGPRDRHGGIAAIGAAQLVLFDQQRRHRGGHRQGNGTL